MYRKPSALKNRTIKLIYKFVGKMKSDYIWSNCQMRFYITNLLLHVFVLVAGEDRQAYRVPNDGCKSNVLFWNVQGVLYGMNIIKPQRVY